MQLTCPKCHGEMRQYERSGVIIDQCGECRGIFLDRGELEKLFEAEANWNQQQGGRQAAPAGGGYNAPPQPPPALLLVPVRL
ncbi:zf-TFIIB domain-containing protein, partial [Micromonospora sp. AMSO31t]|uniref:TFIIB-type zinc ribbon-containing protein n=1 Tax=Micromonospora sp. AMSO31t TaxID=2650566 RepID=UPI001CEDCE7A